MNRRRITRSVARFLIVFALCFGAVWLVQLESIRRIERGQIEQAWSSYDNAHASCLRGQRLRADAARHRDAFRQVVLILDVYLDTAATFRRRSDNADLAAAAESAAALLRRTVSDLQPQAAVDCDVAVRRPTDPRP